MPPKKNQDAEDVLDFINSLPDSKSGTPKPKGNSETDDDNSEDFLEFLDELANHEKPKNSNSTPSTSSKFEPKKKQDKVVEKVDEETAKQESVPVNDEPKQVDDETGFQDANQELEIDPIGTISTWWNNEGTSKVSSIWGSITSNAQQITEQTYQIASNTTNHLNQQRQKLLNDESLKNDQIMGISNRLNSVFLNISHQIREGLISKDDELLNVLLIYDLYNFNFLDRMCFTQFNYVMGQVEGGIKVSVNNFNHNDNVTTDFKTNLNMFHGKIIDGEKLCFANLESTIKDYLKVTKEKDEADNSIKEDEHIQAEKDVNSINKCNIFISIQPITSRINRGGEEGEEEVKEANGPIVIESSNSESFFFTLILKDITNNITITTRTQPFPYRWSKWLKGDSSEFKDLEDIDPGEWVKDWIKEGISLSFGVLAQEYVIKRMGF